MTDRKALGDGKGDRNETRSLDGFPKLITWVNQKKNKVFSLGSDTMLKEREKTLILIHILNFLQ